MLSPRVRKVVDWIVGSVLILVGVVAGLVPMLPGWLFVVAGLAVLSSHSRWAKILHEKLRSLGQRAHAKLRRVGTDAEQGDRRPGDDS